jgi:hypothetical protein
MQEILHMKAVCTFSISPVPCPVNAGTKKNYDEDSIMIAPLMREVHQRSMIRTIP